MDSKRRKMGDEDVSELRQRSRFSYLQKREAEQLALLRRQVAEEAEEEERLGSKLSKDELRSFQRNRETLRLAEARNAIDEHLDGYALPDANSSRTAVLNRKHNEKEKGYEKSEVQLWEDEQLSKIQSQVKRPQRVSAEDYDYVFDTAQEISWTQDGPPIDLEKQRLQATLDEAENKARTIEETRKSLPIYQYKQQFLDAVAAHQILVLVGQTGSGKTTQLTQYLAEAGYAKNGKIGCTQPRRVAAMSVAIRVSEEMGTRVGQDCGYSVRFESKYSDTTKIIYQTDGLLTRTLLTSPMLEEYSAIILDEAHERTVSTEILMALLKEVCAVRPDFRLIVASATLVASDFSDYFGLAPIMNIPGRTFPISKFYASSPEANYLNAAVTTIFQIHLSQGPGDILVFFSGEEEIVQAADFVASTSRKLGTKARPLIVAPVYGALPSEAQQLIFQPTPEGSRKVVLATNIAETSLTIDGIKYVVDSGFCKQMSFNPKTGMNALVVEPCSRASADQRAGRAGRTGPGMVFRLYTKYAFYNELPPSNTAEILRVSLDGPLLTLKSMGINDILGFDLMAKPSPEHIIASLENLYALGYLDSVGNCSKLGRRASELPLDPRLSKVLLSAENLGCVEEAITLVAMVQESGSLFFAPKDQKVAAEQAKSRFASAATEGGDLIALLKVWNEFVENDYSATWAKSSFVQYRSLNRVRDVRDQLMKLCERVEISTDSSCGISDHVKILKCFTSGYFANVARLSRDGQSYSTLKQGLSVYIHPSSCLAKIRPKLVVFAELVLTSKEYMRNCAPIDSAWLSEVAPHYHKKTEIEALDVGRKMPKERLPAKAVTAAR